MKRGKNTALAASEGENACGGIPESTILQERVSGKGSAPASGGKPGKTKKFFTRSAVREEINGFLFAMPVILGLIIFTFIPAVQGFIYAFCSYNGFGTPTFIGLTNFERMFTADWDRDMKYVFANTFLFAFINVPLSLVLGYLLALLLNTEMKGIRVFRTLIYLPCVIPGVVTSLLWADMFSVQGGIINQILTMVGLPEATFFSSSSTSMATFIWTTTWSLGGSMIIWLAAFKNVPVQLQEAAVLDGASYVQRLIHVTIPMTTPMIFYNLIQGIIGSLQMFNTYIVASDTSGKGIDNSLYMFAVKIYTEAFTGNNPALGYASAIGLVLFLIIAFFTALAFATNKWVHYAEDD